MARQPTLRVTAAPARAQTVAPQNNDLSEVAQALTRFNPSLQRFADQRQEEFDEEQARLGRQSAIDDNVSFREAVEAGSLKLGDSPAFRKARMEQIGRNTGLRLRAELAAAYANWEGKDSDDPAALTEFTSTFVRDFSEGIDDGDVLAGFQPEVAQAVNNLSNAHANFTSNRIERDYRENVGVELSLALDELSDDQGNVDLTEWGNLLEDVKAEARLVGFPLSQIDEAVTEAVFSKALIDLDEDFLKVLDQPRADGTPPISSKPAVQKQISQTKATVRQRLYYQQQAEDREDRDVPAAERKAWETRLIDAQFQGEGISPEMAEEAARAIGVGNARSLINAVQGLQETDAPLRGFESEGDLNLANTAAYVRGDREMINQMIFDGRIPPNLRSTYLNAADSQAQQLVSRERENIRWVEAQAALVKKREEREAEERAEAEALERAEANRRAAEGNGDQADRDNRTQAVRENHPELFEYLANGGAPDAKQMLAQIAQDQGWDEARSLFDQAYGAGASLLFVPADRQDALIRDFTVQE